MIKKFEQYTLLNKKISFEKVKEITIFDISNDWDVFKKDHWYRIKKGRLTMIGNRKVFLETYSNIIKLRTFYFDLGLFSIYYDKEFKNGKIKDNGKDEEYFSFYDSDIGYSVKIEELKIIKPDNLINIEIDPYREEDWDYD